jgi:subfamily B ATP-binding cassette protein MsbA
MRRRLEGFIASVEQRQYKLAAIENRASPIMESLGGVAIALVLLYGGYRIIETGATPGEFVSFITAFLLAYEPAKRIARLNINLSRLLMGVRDLFEILDSPPTEADESGLEPVAIERAELRFVDVHFRYAARQPALQGLSFVAEAGQMTALVGESGSGKSTAVALILRFYDPAAGKIEIDGRDIREFPRRALRRQIAYVGQDVFLFRGTIRENIAFGKLGASDEEIFGAAKAAFAHDFIMSFPDGYDTPVGEGGAKLSTGQRQRIAVARALIRDARIILLDEATSSLDIRTEHEVQMAIDRLREGPTCIAIAHRLNTVTQAACIHVLEHGQIVESGTHDELIAKGGIYAGMYRLQSRERAVEAAPGAAPAPLPVAPVAAK